MMTVKEWLGEDNVLGMDIWNNKYRNEGESFEKWLDRVSSGDKEIREAILNKDMLYAGRTLKNINTGNGQSTSNCYSSGYAPDSLEGILELNKNIGLTFKAEGGQGISLSKIRPKGASVKGGKFKSDGIVPFMEIFNTTTQSVSQGGSRKGALMLSIDATHPQAVEFITIKSNADAITKANLSVEVDDAFMRTVKKDMHTGGCTIKRGQFEYDGGAFYYEYRPIDIYRKMMEMAWDNAEPGVLFVNELRNYNIQEFVDDYQVETTNPCGEQPLPKDGACNLLALNLNNVVLNSFESDATIDWRHLEHMTRVGVRALDVALDYNMDNHALENQRIMAEKYRNIGLGVMGLADMFMRMGITYGSEQSKELAHDVMKFIFRIAVYESNDLAKKFGTYPSYDEKVWDSRIMRQAFTEEEMYELKKHGLMHGGLLTVAPTGSIGTMIGVSTGCEPVFMMSYVRRTESLHGNDKEVEYKVYHPVAKEYLEKYREEELPHYFVSSHDIYWKDRVDIQSALQTSVDSAISSTVNLPNEITVEEVMEMYVYAWEMKLKGITMYRDGCARTVILSKDSQLDNKEVVIEEKKEWKLTDEEVEYVKRKVLIGCGSINLMIGLEKGTGKLYDLYTIGKIRGCSSNINSLAIVISKYVRNGGDINDLREAFEGSVGCNSFALKRGKGDELSKGKNCGTAMTNMIIDVLNGVVNEIKEVKKVESKMDICPECGDKGLINEGGCVSCVICGYSKC